MPRDCRTKIVATLGPASSDAATIAALIDAGADVFRLNFSHGSHADHRARHAIIRDLEAGRGRPIGILADLQGPKIRVGQIPGGPRELATGERVRFALEPADGAVPLPHPEVFAALAPGVVLLVDDGKLRLVVEEAGDGIATARVETGGRLLDRKGVSIVGAVLPVSALTEKDRADLAFALELGVDWVALSFVQRPEDVDEVRALSDGRARIMAKLEKPSAIDHLDAIVARADAVMVARGDLGVEMPAELVPTIQRRILRAARAAGKPVVVATQMLESMTETPTPTRAEASDVATAVYEGADAVMLSAESASGRHPVTAVRTMDDIIAAVEADPTWRLGLDAANPAPQATIADTICHALQQAAAVLPVKALVTYTDSGATSLRTARVRPAAPIVALTPSPAVARQLALVWGTFPIVTEPADGVRVIVEMACGAVADRGFAAGGDIVAIAAGMPFGVPGSTNLLRIEQMPAEVGRHGRSGALEPAREPSLEAEGA
jgi:pyruvate kinase